MRGGITGAGRKREQTLMEPRGLQPLTLSLELEKGHIYSW
jgi:hypothetical protein